MIKLIGDKLYQWDIGRQIEIENCENVNEVHFLNLKENTSLILEVNEEMVADIPNILLQMPRDIIGWLVTKSENTSITIHEFTLKVNERQKPSNYVYTETEVKSYESLEKRIKEIEDKGISDEKIAEAVGEYLKENPVETGATQEQVAQIKKNEKDIRNLLVQKADKEYVVLIFEQLKTLIENGETGSAVALLDSAILDLSILA